MRAHLEMLEFKMGDRASFRSLGQGRVEDMLTRYNKKTVTVVTGAGRQWNVSPNLLISTFHNFGFRAACHAAVIEALLLSL